MLRPQIQDARPQLVQAATEARDISARRYRDLQAAQAKAARDTNEARHLKEALAVADDTLQSKQRVAAKAEAIAERMAKVAASAKAEEQTAKREDEQTSQRLRKVSAAVKADVKRQSVTTEARHRAERAATRTSEALAAADARERELLQRHARLERMAAEEDSRQSTRLADAFAQDAHRQAAFRRGVVEARAREQRHARARAEAALAAKAAGKERVAARADAIGAAEERAVRKLRALEHALLRANPELEGVRRQVEEAALRHADPLGPPRAAERAAEEQRGTAERAAGGDGDGRRGGDTPGALAARPAGRGDVRQDGAGQDEAGQDGAGRQWSADDSREAQRALAEEWRSARETAQ